MSDELPAPQEIPDELQERNQWLFWNSSSDRPRKPLASPAARSGASWSDPDEWVSFQEAVDGAEKTPNAGIGYVNAADNGDLPDGSYGVIDLDGVVDPEGGLKEWVPSLEPFFERDAYMEHSPSGEGIHIPIAQIDVPEWWADEHFTADEHEGVEVLSNKFSTFTGNRLRRCGDTVVEHGDWLNDWLREAYTVLYDEKPDNGNSPDAQNLSSNETGLNHDLDAATAEDALDHIDPDVYYPKWRNIGFALRSEFSKSRALSLFKQWSRTGTKWGDEAERKAEKIIEDASPSGGVTFGTLWHYAEQNGWSPPEHSTWKDRDFAETVDKETEDLTDLSDADVWEIWADERENGDLDASSTIPDAGLRHIAREHGYYNFDALPTDTDELPPKAHNRALHWLEEDWCEEHLGEDADATARDYKPRAAVVLTWEDVRYIYANGSKDSGRKAARELLSDRYHFMTLADSDSLQVYDPETGVFTDRTGDIRGEIYEELGENWSTHELNEILAGLRQQSVVQPRHVDAGDRDEPLICVANGVLDVFERELHDHSPDYHFVNRIPVEYDPDADTETYTEFVGDLVDREDRKQTLFEMVGHALLPDANSRYKKFLILTGDADNGKSMFYDCVSTLLNGPEGEENNTAAVKLAKLAQNRFSLNSMYGSLANIAGEIDGKKIRNTANLKDITGGDEVEIEPKGSDSFFDTVGTTLMFAANDPPILGERDKKAIASRIVPLELPYTFVDDASGEYEKERVAEDILREELEDSEALSGFLNLALNGLERLEDNHGDVSLKESPQKRLELYERSADPMREFGTIALQNDPDDYLVKADVVTLYKQYATQQGYEVGSSVEKVLHHALRGLPDLNYTDSQPREPDYTDTSLPLQGWDSRKRVINRATLTEEGMELAEAAGLVEESDDTPDNATEKPRGGGSKPTLKELEPGRHTVEAVVAEQLEPKPWLQGEGTLVDDGELLDYTARGDNNPLSDADEGDRVQIKNAKVTVDRDGLKVLEVTGVCGVTILDSKDADQTSVNDAVEAAATDGGESDESDDTAYADLSPSLIETATENINAEYDSGEEITPPSFAGRHGLSPEQGEAVLEKLTTEKGLLERLDDGYRVL